MRIILIAVLLLFFGVSSTSYTCIPIIHLTKMERIGIAVMEYSNIYELDYKFVLKIIEAESQYNEWAISKYGAVGLMQLRLDTAREVYMKIHNEKLENKQMFDIETNIEIGCFYLKYLKKLFKDDDVKVLCAYNAGLKNVRRWEKRKIKHIPFNETKEYVKKIKTGEKNVCNR